MAVLWPRKLRTYVRKDPKRNAEVLVYDRLGEVLNDKFHVFHSVKWIDSSRGGKNKHGECDFLVAHPKLGILVIEVKGGVEIAFDGITDVWSSKDRNGKIHTIKDPVEQAVDAQYQIRRVLEQSNIWPKKRKPHIAHGVIFPGVEAPVGDISPDKSGDLFCCAEVLNNEFGGWIERHLKRRKSEIGKQEVGEDGIEALRKIFRSSIKLGTSIRYAIAEAKEEFVVLEKSQNDILESITRVEKVVIEGGAGTGKTVMAMDEARRLSGTGLKTLLTCFNRPLAFELERNLREVPNLNVWNFQAVCENSVNKVGYKPPPHRDDDHLFDIILPEALLEVMYT